MVSFHLRSTHAHAQGLLDHSVALIAGQLLKPCRSMPKLDVFIPTTPGRFLRRTARGFDNAIVCDMLGNVAELATSNIFMAKDGVVFTPAAEWNVPCGHYPATSDRTCCAIAV